MATLYKEFCHNIISRIEEEFDKRFSNSLKQNQEAPLNPFPRHHPWHWSRRNAWLLPGLVGAQALICHRSKDQGIHCNSFASPRNIYFPLFFSAEKEFREWRVKKLTHANPVVDCSKVANGWWEQKRSPTLSEVTGSKQFQK